VYMGRPDKSGEGRLEARVREETAEQKEDSSGGFIQKGQHEMGQGDGQRFVIRGSTLNAVPKGEGKSRDFERCSH